MLMEYIDAFCIQRKVDTIYLEVRESNISARSLYSKFGYNEIGIRKKYYAAPIEDAILMQKNLDVYKG